MKKSVFLFSLLAFAAFVFSKEMEAHKNPKIQKYNSYLKFLSKLISVKAILIDSSWQKGRYLSGEHDFLFIPNRDESNPACLQFPFPHATFSYCRENNIDKGEPVYKGYFIYNNFRFPADTDYQRYDPAFALRSFTKFRYHNHTYLAFRGRLKEFNGYGDRINFSYFFSLSGVRKVQDIYTYTSGNIEQPFLYGDLNSDTLLDRIIFEGPYYPSDTGYIMVKAETFSGNKWKLLRDENNQDYFIKLNTKGISDSFSVAEIHWMNKIFE